MLHKMSRTPNINITNTTWAEENATFSVHGRMNAQPGSRICKFEGWGHFDDSEHTSFQLRGTMQVDSLAGSPSSTQTFQSATSVTSSEAHANLHSLTASSPRSMSVLPKRRLFSTPVRTPSSEEEKHESSKTFSNDSSKLVSQNDTTRHSRRQRASTSNSQSTRSIPLIASYVPPSTRVRSLPPSFTLSELDHQRASVPSPKSISAGASNLKDSSPQSERRQQTAKAKNTRAKSIIPVAYMHRKLQRRSNLRVSRSAAQYMARVTEYLAAEVLDGAAHECRIERRKRIAPRHIIRSIKSDQELATLESHVIIPRQQIVIDQ